MDISLFQDSESIIDLAFLMDITDCVHGLQYPGYDHIWDMIFKCTQRNLFFLYPCILVSRFLICAGLCEAYCLQHKAQQFRTLRKVRPLMVGLALINSNTVLQIWLTHLISSDGGRERQLSLPLHTVGQGIVPS